MQIIKNTEGTVFDGCDFVVKTSENRKIRLLQITDMQVIDSTQRRTPDRLRADEIKAWLPENFDALFGNHVRALVAETHPDLIFITGDITYGSFDDSGSTFTKICELMDSFSIPWAPVFGNHDNESKMGVKWQCELFEKCEYCLFKRGSVSGNGNYTVGIAVNDKLVRVLHMLDSNGCKNSSDPEVVKEKGIYPDQLELVRSNTGRIEAAQGCPVPAFAAFHIPTASFIEAEIKKGYSKDGSTSYTIGVDTEAKDRDFGCKDEDITKYAIKSDDSFTSLLRECHVNGVFAGHLHKTNTCIEYGGIRWVFGLKTGQYDYHNIGQTGGTLITLEDGDFEVCHVPSLVVHGRYPRLANMFKELFAE